MSARVLIVEDDATMAEVLVAYVAQAGYEVDRAADGSQALTVWERFKPDVVILDVMLPLMSGLEVLRRRRRLSDPAAVIMLSARGEEEDRLVGLETGADDYVVKPFSPREVILRIGALLRRGELLSGAQLLPDSIDVGELHLELTQRTVMRAGELVALTSREFDLLLFLASHPGRVFSKEDLMRRVWGWDFGDTSTVTVHVRRLREKIELDPSDPHTVVTVGRSGYRLIGEAES